MATLLTCIKNYLIFNQYPMPRLSKTISIVLRHSLRNYFCIKKEITSYQNP